jgi:WD40 repeat protein
MTSADHSLDFFISYSPADEQWAVWIAGTLEAAGYRTMLQAWDFVAGSRFIELMDRGVSQSAIVLAVLSRSYLQSRYGRMEWQAALRAAPENPQTKLITVRVENCELSGLLAQFTYVDLVGVDDPQAARELLLRRVRETLAGRARPMEQPAFPRSSGTPVVETTELAASRPRQLPVITPAYPAATATGVERAGVTLLHVSAPCVGRGLLSASGRPDTGGLHSRIFGEVTQLVLDGAPKPDLLLVSGDLTAAGGRKQSQDALDFLIRLRVRLGMAPDRVMVVPGPLDVNRSACRAHFEDCEADDQPPTPPYWPKWRHFTTLFRELYQGIDDVVFECGQPWTLFTIPELRMVVAGVNTTLAISHRDEDRYGVIEHEQAAWFAHRLREYEDAGWLRVGLMRHPPSGAGGLRDSAIFSRLVAPRLNLLVHGPGPAGSELYTTGAGLTCLSLPTPGQCELLSLMPDGLVRWTDPPGEAPVEPVRVPLRWRQADTTFSTEVPAVEEESEVRETVDPTNQLLNRIEEVCRARHERVRIRRVKADPPYLLVTYNDDGIVRELGVAACVAEPSAEEVDAFRQLVRSADPDFVFELVYQGSPPPRQMREEARRAGVRLRSFVEFQGLIDLRSYVAEQTVRLGGDKQYPPDLYVPQRFSQLDRAEEPIRSGLVEELLQQLNSDYGRFILLLGDFGRGKTFALREVARRIPIELPHLTPVLIELRTLDKAHSIEGLVAAHLADHDERNIDLRAFQYMLRQGRIVLLFDGFDELVTRTTYDRAADHLDTLLGAAVDSAKIVVTSRTQHFQSRAQVLTKLGERVGLLPQRRVLNIEEFTPEQIREYLVNHYGGDEARATVRLRLISGVENLIELSHNPRMLSFVADLPEDRLVAVARVGHAMSAAGLYREILSFWLTVEERRTRGVPGGPEGLSLAELWRAVTRLALRLWEANESVLSIADLAEAADALADLAERPMSSDHAVHALGAGTLLVQSDEGLFGFIHGSIVEWLVANEIATRLSQGVASLLSHRVLSQLSVDFLCDLADARVCEEWAGRVLSNPDADQTARINAGKVRTRLRIPAHADLRHASFQGEDLSYRDLAEVDLTGANLTDARLVGANLAGAVLRDARLVGTRLDEAVLEGADLTGADLTGARLLRTDLRRVTVTGSRWPRAALVGATVGPGLAGAPELRDAAITPGMPVEPQIAPAMIGVPYGFHGKYGRLPQPLAYHADGGTLAIGCDNGGVLICDTSTGLPVRTLSGHRGRVYAVVAVPNGDLLTAGADGAIKMWDSTRGVTRWVRGDYHDWVWPVVVGERGGLVAAGDSSGTVHLLDVATGVVRHALTGPTPPVWTGAFGPDDALFASGASDGVVRIWDTATGRLVRELGGHGGSVYRLVLSRDGHLLAASDQSGAVRVWDVVTGRLVHELTGHARAVYALDFHPDGELLVSADTGGSIRLWRLSDGHPVGVLDDHANAVYQVLFSPHGQLLASCDSGGAVRLWTVTPDRTPPLRPHAELIGHLAAVWPGAFRPDSAQLATVSNDGTARLWETDSGHCRHVLRGHGRRISSVSFSPTGTLVAACSNDGVVRLWDPVTGQLVRPLTGTADQLVSAMFSPVGHTVAAASNDGGVYMLNTESGVAERELDVETDNVWAEAFSPDGRVLATANDDDTVRLWFHHTGAQGHALTEHRGRVRSIVFAPDGTTIATGCDDRKVRLWDVSSGECRATLEGHSDRVYSVSFHPDGSLLVSSSWDRTVRVWDPATGSCRHVLTGHTGRIWATAFHPGGNLIASAGDDTMIRLWDPHTGRSLGLLEGHPGRVLAVAFSPDGTQLASGGDDGTVRLWDVTDPDARALRITLVSQSEGWAAIGIDGRYKVHGSVGGAFWYAVGPCRFEPGELDPHLTEIRRIPLEAPF